MTTFSDGCDVRGAEEFRGKFDAEGTINVQPTPGKISI